MKSDVPSKDYERQHRDLLPEILAEFARVIREEEPILGESVAAFERQFAAWCGADFAIGTGTGTDALVVALRALGIGEGDEVITASNTFVATVSAILLVGARPVLVEPDESTMTLDPLAMAAAVGPRTRAVIPVHLYGRLCDMSKIGEIARRHDFFVVEDAAQAHGAHDADGTVAGAFGIAGCFSFHPSKILGAFGDGGIVTTSDATLADKARMIRHLGKRTKWEVDRLGPNTKLDTLQAALLRIKMKYVDAWIARHLSHAAHYRTGLAGVGDLLLPDDPRDGSHVFHLYVVRTERRDELRSHLKANGINAGIHYPIPPHLQSFGPDHPPRPGAFPIAERLGAGVLSLPISHELTDDEIDRVIAAIRGFYGR